MRQCSEREERTWREEIELNAKDLVERIRELIREGNVRHLTIKKENGELLLEIPLSTGLIAGGLVTLAAPVLAALGALAALLTRVRVEVVRIDQTGKKDDAGNPGV
ncbi:MAG TPA: DUF4342 domain-containing protein [Atribacteraceae bacterium]|nr:DUF4342 domain-containing protein [Atribacteraceae bacterium]